MHTSGFGTMLDLLLAGPFAPFTLALAVLMGLLALELIASFAGGSILGSDMEIDAGPDAPDADLEAGSSPGVASWLGLGDLPFVIWMASILLGFGVSGLVVQTAAAAVASPLPGWLASVPAAVLAVLFARGFGRVLARLVPRTESSASTARQLARRRGVVTQGVATRGRPAEVRVVDRHGNSHFLRAEPLDDADAIPEGSEVLVLPETRGDGYRLVALSDEP